MKQHITLEQLNELDDVAMRKLAEYKGLEEFDKTTMEVWRKSDNKWETVHLLLNIGQMIEFLDEKEEGVNIDSFSELDGDKYGPSIFTNNNEISVQGSGCDIESSELCDVLWEAVKSILEK